MSIEIYNQDYIVRVIRSCYNIDHLNSCRNIWIPHLLRRRIIHDQNVITIIQYELNEKEKELETPRKERITLPYLKKRAERVQKEEEEKRKHLKLVPSFREEQSL